MALSLYAALLCLLSSPQSVVGLVVGSPTAVRPRGRGAARVPEDQKLKWAPKTVVSTTTTTMRIMSSAQQPQEEEEEDIAPSETFQEEKKKPRVVVVGAGWGGFGAAKALAENGCEVTVLDAGDPLTPMTSDTGKPVEPGMRGFWKDYPNINKLGDELNLGDIYTPFTESSFHGPDGLECTAPVFSSSNYPELPSPFGQVLASFDRFTRLPITDRLSILGLFAAMVDLQRSEKAFRGYDRMSAHELFIKVGVTKRLVDDFLKPTLLVGLFKPPEELSAAVTMELLYYYALAHQTSFDVRWLKKGTVQEIFFKPLAEYLKKSSETDVIIRPGSFVKTLHYDETSDRVDAVTYVDRDTRRETALDSVDAVVMAVGATGMRAIMANSPNLAKRCPEMARAASLSAIDVVAVRLWLDETVETDAPVGVFAKFPSLRGAGGTFFMLDQLQADDLDALWGGSSSEKNNDNKRGSVVACDFYNAGAVVPLSDGEIVRVLTEDLLPRAYPKFRDANVVDFHVKRYPRAVSHFAPGSFENRPPLVTSLPNLVNAGDWVRMGDLEHGAKGLCQERAFVSGLKAANYLDGVGALPGSRRISHPVLDVRDDEPAYVAGVRLNKFLWRPLERLGLADFWVR